MRVKRNTKRIEIPVGEEFIINGTKYTYVRSGKLGHWLIGPSGKLVHTNIPLEEILNKDKGSEDLF